MDLTLATVLFLAATAFAAGVVDAMAGGGGLLTIPALLAAGVPPVSAIATNKLQGAIGTGSAFATYLKAGHVDLRAFAAPAAGAFLGAIAGATAIQFVDTRFLSALVPLLLIAMALYMSLAPRMTETDRHARLGRAGMTGLITLIGFYDGFFGPGTGSFLTTALVALGGLGLVRAIGNTKFINLVTNLAALVALIAGGKVLWLLGAAMAGANVAGNQIGARLAIRHAGRGVRPLLVIVSTALAIKLLVDPANPLHRLLVR